MDKLHLGNPVLISLSKFITNIPDKPGDFIVIIALIIIVYIFYLLIKLHYSKADILNNWSKNRCNLSILPIAGFIKPIGKKKYVGLKGTSENFKYCIDTISGSFVGVLIEPFLIIIGLLEDTFKEMYDLVDDLIERSEGIMENILAQFLKYEGVLKNIGRILTYVNYKLDSIKVKTLAIIDNLFKFINEIIDISTKVIIDNINLSIQFLKVLIHAQLASVFIQTAITLWMSYGSIKAAILSVSGLGEWFWGWPMSIAKVLNIIATIISIIIKAIILSYNMLIRIFIGETLGLFNLEGDRTYTSRLSYIQTELEKARKDGGCFTNLELINNDGIKIHIKDINPGEILYGGIMVTSHITININKVIEIYKYRNIEVTGDHMVLHNNKWMRISEVYLEENLQGNALICEKIEKFVSKLYCINTSTNEIRANGIIFRDYNETNDKLLLSYINYYVSKEINSNREYKNKDNLIEYSNHIYPQCFSNDTMSYINNSNSNNSNSNSNNSNSNNSNSNNNIIGKVKLLNNDSIKLYNYKGYVMSGNVLVLEDTTWIRVWERKLSMSVICEDKYLYHVISDNNEINIGKEGIKIRDYVESSDDEVNYKINKMICNNLNE